VATANGLPGGHGRPTPDPAASVSERSSLEASWKQPNVFARPSDRSSAMRSRPGGRIAIHRRLSRIDCSSDFKASSRDCRTEGLRGTLARNRLLRGIARDSLRTRTSSAHVRTSRRAPIGRVARIRPRRRSLVNTSGEDEDASAASCSTFAAHNRDPSRPPYNHRLRTFPLSVGTISAAVHE
jgi:hypothetical protein